MTSCPSEDTQRQQLALDAAQAFATRCRMLEHHLKNREKDPLSLWSKNTVPFAGSGIKNPSSEGYNEAHHLLRHLVLLVHLAQKLFMSLVRTPTLQFVDLSKPLLGTLDRASLFKTLSPSHVSNISLLQCYVVRMIVCQDSVGLVGNRQGNVNTSGYLTPLGGEELIAEEAPLRMTGLFGRLVALGGAPLTVSFSQEARDNPEDPLAPTHPKAAPIPPPKPKLDPNIFPNIDGLSMNGP
eukprot:154716-Amphidinium_carterae.1